LAKFSNIASLSGDDVRNPKRFYVFIESKNA
jgi:hypothetical protein